MTEAASAQRRSFYRLRYFDDTNAPIVTVDQRTYPVCELSEGGARFHSDSGDEFIAGQTIAGRIRFDDDGEEPFEGVILRFERPEIIVRFNRGISFKRMLDEQRRMRANYPHLYRPNR